jgi:hypothetical protein
MHALLFNSYEPLANDLGTSIECVHKSDPKLTNPGGPFTHCVHRKRIPAHIQRNNPPTHVHNPGMPGTKQCNHNQQRSHTHTHTWHVCTHSPQSFLAPFPVNIETHAKTTAEACDSIPSIRNNGRILSFVHPSKCSMPECAGGAPFAVTSTTIAQRLRKPQKKTADEGHDMTSRSVARTLSVSCGK